MKIAIPVADGHLCLHFGHCEQFAIIEADENTKEILSQEFVQPPHHEPGVIPRWLHQMGANVIIASGMGQRAQQIFIQNGISVVTGAPPDDPKAIASSYLSGTLETGENACDH